MTISKRMITALVASGMIVGTLTGCAAHEGQQPPRQQRVANTSEDIVSPSPSPIGADTAVQAPLLGDQAPAVRQAGAESELTDTPAEPTPSPSPEPPAPPGNSAPEGAETPPLGRPAPTLPGMGCLPQEIGMGIRSCPTPTGSAASTTR